MLQIEMSTLFPFERRQAQKQCVTASNDKTPHGQRPNQAVGRSHQVEIVRALERVRRESVAIVRRLPSNLDQGEEHRGDGAETSLGCTNQEG